MHNYIFIKSNIIAFVLPDLCIRCHVKEMWVLLGAECMLIRLGTHSALMLSFKLRSHRANGRVTDRKLFYPFVSVLCPFLIR